MPGSDIEVISFAIVLATVAPHVPTTAPVRSFSDAQSVRTQLVCDTSTGAVIPWAVHERAELSIGARVAGPAIIIEDETSTLVGPGWRALVNGLGYLDIVREAT